MTTTTNSAKNQNLTPEREMPIFQVLSAHSSPTKTFNFPLTSEQMASLKPLRRPLRRAKPAK